MQLLFKIHHVGNAIETLKFISAFENIYHDCRVETTKHKKPLKTRENVLPTAMKGCQRQIIIELGKLL